MLMRYDELMVHSGQAVFRCRERIRKAGDAKKKLVSGLVCSFFHGTEIIEFIRDERMHD